MLKPCICSFVTLFNFIDFSVFSGSQPLSVGYFLFTCKTIFLTILFVLFIIFN